LKSSERSCWSFLMGIFFRKFDWSFFEGKKREKIGKNFLWKNFLIIIFKVSRKPHCDKMKFVGEKFCLKDDWKFQKKIQIFRARLVVGVPLFYQFVLELNQLYLGDSIGRFYWNFSKRKNDEKRNVLYRKFDEICFFKILRFKNWKTPVFGKPGPNLGGS